MLLERQHDNERKTVSHTDREVYEVRPLSLQDVSKRRPHHSRDFIW